MTTETTVQAANQTLPRGPYVVGLFETREQAEGAVDALVAARISPNAISAVTADGKSMRFPSEQEAEHLHTGARNTAIGAAVGTIAGFAILGPLLLPIVLLAGAIVGGLAGIFTEIGATPELAEQLTESVRAGKYLVAVRTDDEGMVVTSILQQAGASNVHRLPAGATK